MNPPARITYTVGSYHLALVVEGVSFPAGARSSTVLVFADFTMFDGLLGIHGELLFVYVLPFQFIDGCEIL